MLVRISNRWSEADDQFLPVLVRQVDKDSGLIVTSLLDMPIINSGSTEQQLYIMCAMYRLG